MEREEIQLLIISFSIVLFTLLLTVFILFFFFLKKKSKFLIDKMEAELFFQSELTKSKIEIKEQTLTNVSRELHDNIGQILSVALMQMNIIIESDEEYSKKNLKNIKELVTKSLNEIRLLSKVMNGDIFLNTSFISAISEDLERIKELKKIKCKLNIDGEIQIINKEHETIIYRILQESISNILKHSHSDSIIINILFTEDNCKIDVIDTGKGFDLLKSIKGSGLSNIETRANLIGAHFTIYSEENKGTVLMIDYPIKTEDYNQDYGKD
ncbi:histidine kinase [Flavobacterium sp.]|uniref:sensor histidine kinase n=1 Tax=Flavobacterium sp. TaxID=239 RepID=UPI00286E2651|nr:histidine kinase [Flavobacterium sp.]